VLSAGNHDPQENAPLGHNFHIQGGIIKSGFVKFRRAQRDLHATVKETVATRKPNRKPSG